MTEFCSTCGEYRQVMVGFHGDIYCVRCDMPLNEAARKLNYEPWHGWDNYLTIIWGAPHRVIIATDQHDVPGWHHRVIDVFTRQAYTVPTGHLHFTYA